MNYSIVQTSKMPYGDQLKQIENRKMNGSNSLYIGKPSESLLSAGLSDAPFAMNQGDYRKSRRETAKNKNYSSHSVPYEFFENMPQHLSDAPMLIDNGEKVSVITSYGMKDTKNQDSFVIAGVRTNQTMESDTVNLVKSAYPWDDFVQRIKSNAEAGKLVVTNKNKAEQMLTTIGIQPAEVSNILNLARDSLSQKKPPVKQQFSISDAERVFYTPRGVEVVQNPTNAEYRNMREEIYKEYPHLRGTGEAILRHTYDESGNEYYWNAFDGMHRDVEPYINKQYNTRTSQQWEWWTRDNKDEYATDYSSVRYSVSDNSGKQLTKGQQEYFKDSKMRDENGNLNSPWQNGGSHPVSHSLKTNVMLNLPVSLGVSDGVKVYRTDTE